jgi:hypothetical protein
MSITISSAVDWSPEVFPCAPRPINGELLSSWTRRLAGANGITFPEICACVGDLLGSREQAAVFDYGAPKRWRLTMASMARIPERWVWVLDLQQQFPAIGREWFLHNPARPERILSGFCPECFHEQVAARQILHLKAEWAVALVTRCFPAPTAVVSLLPMVRPGPARSFPSQRRRPMPLLRGRFDSEILHIVCDRGGHDDIEYPARSR